MASLYVGFLIVLNQSGVSRKIAHKIEYALSEKLGTQVSIGDLKIEFLNHAEIRDIKVLDQNKQIAFAAKRFHVDVELLPLFSKSIVVKTMGLYEAECKLYRPTKDGKLNIQFLIDSLSSSESDTKSNVKFKANSILCRNIKVDYDITDEFQTLGHFNPAHIHLNKLNGNFKIYSIEQDSFNVRVRNLCFEEESGFVLKRTTMQVVNTPQHLLVQNLNLHLPNSQLQIPACEVLWKPQYQINSALLQGNLALQDFQSFLPELSNFQDEKLVIYSQLNKNANSLLYDVKLADGVHPSNLIVRGQGSLNQGLLQKKPLQLDGHLAELKIAHTKVLEISDKLNLSSDLSKILFQLGNVSQEADFTIYDKDIAVVGKTETEAGTLQEDVCWNGNDLNAKVGFADLNTDIFFANYDSLRTPKKRNVCSGEISVVGKTNPQDLKYSLKANQLALDKYNLKNVSLAGNLNDHLLTGDLDLNDDKLQIKANLSALHESKTLRGNLVCDLGKLNLREMHISENFGNANLQGNVAIQMELPMIKETILQSLSNLGTLHEYSVRALAKNVMIEDTVKTITLDSALLRAKQSANGISIRLNSDVADLQIESDVELKRIPDLALTFLSHSFPAISDYCHFSPIENKKADFSMTLKKTDLLSFLLKKNIKLNGNGNVQGFVDGKQNNVNLTAWFPAGSIDDDVFQESSVFVKGKSETINVLAQTGKMFDENEVKFVFAAKISDNQILPKLEWKTINNQETSGNLQAVCKFSKNNEFYGTNVSGTTDIDIQIQPSQIYISDTLWTLQPAHVALTGNKLKIFSPVKLQNQDKYIELAEHKSQDQFYHLNINGIEVAHVLNLVEFHSVDFSGKVFGEIDIPVDMEQAEKIPFQMQVKDFCFNDAPLGTLDVSACWLSPEKAINLDAITQRGNDNYTKIQGTVFVGEDRMELHFDNKRTNAAFLNKWLHGVLGPVKGNVSGNLCLYGPLSLLDFEGYEVIDTLFFTPSFNNVPYKIVGDTLFFRENRLLFQNFHVSNNLLSNRHEITSAQREGTVTINGAVTHRKLHDFGYDLRFNAKDVYAYNRDGGANDTFWGNVFAQGAGRLWGTTSQVNVRLNMSPCAGSTFYYNQAETDNAVSSEFIRFKSMKPTFGKKDSPKTISTETQEIKDTDTDIHLNIAANLNPNVQVILYTDYKTKDGLYLYGNGPLNINWHNKGTFSINGQYTTTAGQYQLTIQELMHRTFNIQPNGYLRFTGNAEEGDLGLQGVYTVHSVSLSDLNLGENISNATTNVNCLLNFSGKTSNPQVTFGLDFPTARDDIGQTLRSAISSQEDLNMQMLYLLTVGRFYTYDNETYLSTGQSQTSLAMQSLFANTLGSSLSNIINSALPLGNWRFNPNISTGRLGFDDMEVGGQVEGSLLQNRLQLSSHFGYREQNTYTNNFVGDFNIRYLLSPKGGVSLKAYSETNDRYFSRSSLSTQGGGLQFQRNFNQFKQLFHSPSSINNKTEKRK